MKLISPEESVALSEKQLVGGNMYALTEGSAVNLWSDAPWNGMGSAQCTGLLKTGLCFIMIARMPDEILVGPGTNRHHRIKIMIKDQIHVLRSTSLSSRTYYEVG